MDKYDKFIANVQERTASGDLRWEVCSNSEASPYVSDFSKILRCYKARFKGGFLPNDLLLVEKTRERFTDYAERFDEYAIELFVLEDSTANPNVCIFTVDENYVNREELRALVELVRAENSSAKRFFADFE